jgi:hypothetical protein
LFIRLVKRAEVEVSKKGCYSKVRLLLLYLENEFRKLNLLEAMEISRHKNADVLLHEIVEIGNSPLLNPYKN